MNFSHIKNKRGFNIAVKIISVVLGLILCGLTVVLTERGMAGNRKAEGIISAAVISSSSEQGSSSEETPPSSSEPLPAGLVMHNPAKRDVTVTEEKFTFKGSCPEPYGLTFGEEKIELAEDGSFQIDVKLKIGENKFTFGYNGQKYNYVIRYRYVVIKAYSPSDAMSFRSGASFNLVAAARIGCESVKASFYGSEINLVRDSAADTSNPEGFCNYSAVYTLPESGISDKNLGKVKFTATFGDITESFSSGNITCRDPMIAEVVAETAETFNGNTRDNDSRPTNNYLPKGTVDYVEGSFSMMDGRYKNNFLILACGRRIYSDAPVTPGNSRMQVSKTYMGKLPDHNELSVASVRSDTERTYLTLNTMWKAPFFFDLKPQSYTNPSSQDYTVSSFTATYAEISFCYSTSLTGSVDFTNNPLFSRAEIFAEGGNCKMRLHFKKQGGFYGWDCYYNSQNQLVFEFLHPKRAAATDANVYGADLSGIKILVDAGHGGFDGGAVNGSTVEKERNLSLAFKIKTELEKCGATVYMTRTSDVAVRSDNRSAIFRSKKPDFCVSVHHDSSTATSPNGFGSFYSSPFSAAAAKLIYDETINKTGIYSGGNRNKVAWHYFFMARLQYCPSVLTENGYMSGRLDSANIRSEAVNQQKAEAIARGIVRYFLSQS